MWVTDNEDGMVFWFDRLEHNARQHVNRTPQDWADVWAKTCLMSDGKPRFTLAIEWTPLMFYVD
jgi:hypothetical protein